jgi:muramoyltetrapeptide carboxypeptidase
VLGRFPVRANIDAEVLAGVLERRRGLRGIPIAADLDFGHTLPMFTIPMGGTADLSVTEAGVALRWLVH